MAAKRGSKTEDNHIRITLPGGEAKEVPVGTTVGELAEELEIENKMVAAALKVSAEVSPTTDGPEIEAADDEEAAESRFASGDQRIIDFSEPLTEDAELEFLKPSDERALAVLHHSTAHVMADAIRRLYPGTKLWVGPPITQPFPGFYYDIDCPHQLSEDDFKAIEAEMKKIVKAKQPFVRRYEDRKQAIKHFQDDEPDEYKVDLLQRFEDKEVSFYRHSDEFEDLCRGPHIPHTGWIKAFKLMRLAGAYWKGDETHPMLQRVYGTAFFDKKDLKALLDLIAEAKRRDHRTLGKEMDLFSFSEYAPSMPFFHPRGMQLLDTIVAFSKAEHKRRGYVEIQTPQILSQDLWKLSGHMDNYHDNMFFTEVVGHGGKKDSRRPMAIKPMNCPGGMIYYNTSHHSYQDLPLRVAEFGKVHRMEKSGVTHGLLRVKAFVQDDAHLFCTDSAQLKQEILGVLDFILFTYKVFNFTDVHLELSTRPKKSIGADEAWRESEATLEETLKESGQPWKLNPGDGAFYGPKIDAHVKDALGRSWQLGTIQVDFALPQRFGLTFADKDDIAREPIMIHRTIMGSLERFMGVVIENYAGAFPVWLHPVQVKVLPISEKVLDYGREVTEALDAAGVRVELDARNERIGKKIREAAKVDKVPYSLILGEKEAENRQVSVRVRGEGDAADQGAMDLDAFLAQLKAEIKMPSSR